MDKISISDFCGEEKTYAQLIQDLYFHISVKELYMVLASNAAQIGHNLSFAKFHLYRCLRKI